MALDELRRFDLNLLLAFDVMMAERNVSRAARRLALGQPATSHALARLRERFGDPLFVRASGMMQPTPRALELAGPIAQVLADIRRNVLDQRAFEPLADRRIVRAGTSDHAEITVIRPVLQALQREGPGIRIVVAETDRDRVGTMLESGAIDLAIGYFPEAAGQLRREVLFHEELVSVFDPQGCGIEPPLGLEEYLALPHVVMSLRGEIEGVVDQALGQSGRSRRVIAATPHFLAIPSLLYGMRAVAALPRRLAEHCLEASRLAVSELPVPVDGYDVSLVWHRRTDQDAVHVWFRELVRRSSGAVNSAPPSPVPGGTASGAAWRRPHRRRRC